MRRPSLGEPSLWQLGDAWLRRSAAVIAASADALNAMNVFPISDADTGSNLELTIGGIASSVTRFQRATLDDVVQAAILSAHGNSGAIVAEMFTSVCRALARHPERLAVLPPGGVVAALLRTVSDAANQAVAEPVLGTILTVADEAARGAADAARDPEQSRDALAVARAAQHASHTALARTPEQLDVLGRAGVVDAGGQAFVLLIDVLVEVLGGPSAEPLVGSARPAGQTAVKPSVRSSAQPPAQPPARSSAEPSPMEYEVMYAVRGAPVEQLDRLRRELSELGRSVVVVGDQAIAQVHVHLLDAGAAVECALGVGELSRIRVTALGPPSVDAAAGPGAAVAAGVQGAPNAPQAPKAAADPSAPDTPDAADAREAPNTANALDAPHAVTEAPQAERTLIAVVAGPGLARAATDLGAIAIERHPAADVPLDELSRAIAAAHGDVVVLPNDPATLATARRIAAATDRDGRRVTVVPTTAQVQGMAALAVHEPSADFAATVLAMASAAGHARHGAVTVAERSAMTMAGPCRAGDVLGLVDGDFVEIGASPVEVGWRVIERLLAGGGELLTLVGGDGVADGVLEELARRATAARRTLEIERLDGGQPRYLLLVGLE